MINGINDGEPVKNKTGFSMEQLTSMTKPQLLTIFDANNSGTVSDKEITLKGIEGEELAAIRDRMNSVEIEKEVEQPKPKRKTREIEGVTFYDDEVLFVKNSSYENFWSGATIRTVKVTTPNGVFEYLQKDQGEDNSGGSILGNKVKNMCLHSYTGTEKNDKLYLKNSLLAHIDIEGGGKDIIYYDKNSCARDVSYWHHDDNDEIRFQNKDGSWEVEQNPYR